MDINLNIESPKIYITPLKSSEAFIIIQLESIEINSDREFSKKRIRQENDEILCKNSKYLYKLEGIYTEFYDIKLK